MEVFLNGISLHYIDNQKSGVPAVVFIHGFPFDHTMWQEQLAACDRYFRVVAYDQRGHGKSQAGSGQYTFESFVDDFLSLLDYLQLSKVIVCGLSMGGYLALRAFERAPERIQGLILCDTQSFADTNEGKLKRAAQLKTIQEKGVAPFAEGFLKAAFASSSFTNRASAVEQIRKTILGNPPKGVSGTLIALATRTDTTASLSNIKVPTLLLVGDQDAITPPKASEEMHGRIAGSQLTIIKNAGHLSNLENPADFNSALTQYLKTFVGA